MTSSTPAAGLRERPVPGTPIVLRIGGAFDGRLALVHEVSYSSPLQRDVAWVKMDGDPELHALGFERLELPAAGRYEVGDVTFEVGGAGFIRWRSDCDECASRSPDAFAPSHGPKPRCAHGGRTHCTGDGCW